MSQWAFPIFAHNKARAAFVLAPEELRRESVSVQRLQGNYLCPGQLVVIIQAIEV